MFFLCITLKVFIAKSSWIGRFRLWSIRRCGSFSTHIYLFRPALAGGFRNFIFNLGPAVAGGFRSLTFVSRPAIAGGCRNPVVFPPRRCGPASILGCRLVDASGRLLYSSCGRVLNIASEGDELYPCRRCGPMKDLEMRFMADYVWRRHGECWLPRCTCRCGGFQTPRRPTNESVAARPRFKAYALCLVMQVVE